MSIQKISTESAEHYHWAESCEGWHLVEGDGLSVIQERVPSGKSETKHYHNAARQFFYVLEGEATIEVDAQTVTLSQREGVEIPQGVPHQFRNDSDRDVVFLVISSPESHGDRIEI